MLPLMRRFVWLSAYMTPAAMISLWKYRFTPRVATKMTLGNTIGSAMLDILNCTSTLDVDTDGTAAPGGGGAAAAAAAATAKAARPRPKS